MYRQLMYAPNIKIMEQIASEIGNTLKRNILQKSNMMRGQTFAELFRRYLISKCKNMAEEKLCDFKCNVDGKDICFELKIYNSDYAIEKNIKRACERLLRLKGDNLILVIGNIVSKEIKTSVYKGYKQDKIEMRGDRAEMSDFPLYLNTVAGGLDRRDQTIGGFSFVVKIYAVPVVEIIG